LTITWKSGTAATIPGLLAGFLGLNEEEEDIWIEESDEALKELLDSKK